MAKACKECGFPLTGNEQTCPECGAPVGTTTTTQSRCLECGYPLTGSETVCPECGNPLQTQRPAQQPQQPQTAQQPALLIGAIKEKCPFISRKLENNHFI